MAKEHVLVGYQQINAALKGDHARGLAEAREAMDASATVAGESASLMAEFRVAIQELQKSETNPRVLSSPQNQMAAALQSYLAARSLETGKVEQIGEGRLEAKFDPVDWAGWVKSFFTWFKRLRDGRHKLLPPNATVPRIDRKFRMAILGDWGTGMYGAPICAKTIETDQRGYSVLLHLGDVYYSGTEEEERNRFLGLWPNVSSARNYSLNSNHEMYTGGYGYFDVLLGDRRFQQWQSSSYFAFENEDFLFIGLDTAYSEHDIVDDELTWLRGIITSAGKKRVVLFSHHQPFSLLDQQGPKLQVRLAEFLDEQRIFAWYWGHEHRCVIYEQHETWGLYGRCIGHSGFPYYRGSVQNLPAAPSQKNCWRKIEQQAYAPAAIVLDGPNPYIADDPDKYGPHGYLTLEVENGSIIEHIHDPNGNILYDNLLA